MKKTIAVTGTIHVKCPTDRLLTFLAVPKTSFVAKFEHVLTAKPLYCIQRALEHMFLNEDVGFPEAFYQENAD